MKEPQTVTSRRSSCTGFTAVAEVMGANLYLSDGGMSSQAERAFDLLDHLLGRDRLRQVAVAAGLPRPLLVAAHGVRAGREDRHRLGAHVVLKTGRQPPAHLAEQGQIQP